MLRRSFVALAIAALAASAPAAQISLPSGRVQRVTAPVRDAGILHVASNTWTRKASSAALGLDTIYDNTKTWPSPWAVHVPLSGDTFVDEGRVPSPTSPTHAQSRPGCATSYTVDGFQIRYCTDQPDPALEVRFFESHLACATTVGVTPTAAFALAGLPGSAGALACWTVTLDLASPPPGLAFTMRADGDGTYAGIEAQNRFGWSIRSSLPSSQQSATGPFLSGDLGGAQSFDGTRWDDVVDYTERGHGMGTSAQFRIENGPTTPGCYFFESPFPSFHLELYADACPGLPFMTPYCVGDVPGSACPCTNGPPHGNEVGCRNSLGVGGRLRGSGVPSIGLDALLLVADQLPPSSPLLFFQGTARQMPITALGDGLRCVSGTVTRLATKIAVGGTARFPDAGDPSVSVRGGVTAPGTRDYQVWYRNAVTFCTPATFNLTNGWEVRWTP